MANQIVNYIQQFFFFRISIWVYGGSGQFGNFILFRVVMRTLCKIMLIIIRIDNRQRTKITARHNNNKTMEKNNEIELKYLHHILEQNRPNSGYYKY